MTMDRRSSLLMFSFLLLVAVALAAVAFLFLPQLKLPGLARAVKERTGLTLTTDASPSFSWEEGFSLRLQNIVLADDQQQSVPVVQAVKGEAAMALFSGGINDITLEDAVFSFDLGQVRTTASVGPQTPLVLRLRNSAVKVSKRPAGFNLALTDVNGEVHIDQDGALLVDARFLLNGRSTQVTASFDSIARLLTEGTPSDIALTTGEQALTLSGRAKVSPEPSFDGTVSASAADVNAWLNWLGLGVQGFDRPQALSIEGAASLSLARLQVIKGEFSVADMKAVGDVAVTLGEGRPLLTATVKMPVLDVNAYLDPETPVPAEPKPRSLLEPWSERALDFSDLDRLNAEVSVDADMLRFGHFKTDAAKATAVLKDGVLVATLQSQSSFGGTLDGKMQLQKRDGAVSLEFKAVSKTADATALLSNLFGLEKLGGGISLDLDLKAQGVRETEFLASLAGTAKITLEKGKINGFDGAKLFAPDHAQGWPVSPAAFQMGGVSVDVTLQDGIAKMTKGTVASEPPISFEGEIDILRRALELKITQDNSTRTLVGPWQNPAFAAAVP